MELANVEDNAAMKLRMVMSELQVVVARKVLDALVVRKMMIRPLYSFHAVLPCSESPQAAIDHHP